MKTNDQVNLLNLQNAIYKTALTYIVQHLDLMSSGNIKPSTWHIATNALRDAAQLEADVNNAMKQGEPRPRGEDDTMPGVPGW